MNKEVILDFDLTKQKISSILNAFTQFTVELIISRKIHICLIETVNFLIMKLIKVHLNKFTSGIVNEDIVTVVVRSWPK